MVYEKLRKCLDDECMEECLKLGSLRDELKEWQKSDKTIMRFGVSSGSLFVIKELRSEGFEWDNSVFAWAA